MSPYTFSSTHWLKFECVSDGNVISLNAEATMVVLAVVVIVVVVVIVTTTLVSSGEEVQDLSLHSFHIM